MSRNATMAEILENMSLVKRGMAVHMQAVLGKVPISLAQLELLHIIKQEQPITAKDLAQSRQLTPGAISQLLDSLLEHGYVARKMHETDRRTHLLQVTKKGAKLLQTVRKRRDELFKTVMADCSDEELLAWLQVQQKIMQKLDFTGTPTKQKGN